MGFPAARITDMHTCPMVTVLVPHVGGPIVTGSFNVITGSMPQARVTDMCVCVGPPDVIVKGSATVLVNYLPAARIFDMTAHGGVIVTGFPTVLIGDSCAGGGGGGGGAPGGPGGQLKALEAGKSGDPTKGDEAGGMMASAAGMPSPADQAKALRDAAKTGTPFVERCAAAKSST
jgi:uncharacterized Zn-binding protein involved in type VI secretion